MPQKNVSVTRVIGTCVRCSVPLYSSKLERAAMWRGDPRAVRAGSGGMCTRCYRRWRSENPGSSLRSVPAARRARPAPQIGAQGAVILAAARRRFSLDETRRIGRILGLLPDSSDGEGQ